MDSQKPSELIKSEEQLHGLSIRDMVRTAALNLRGSSKTVENGYCIELRSYSNNLLTSITLQRSTYREHATDLTIETGRLKENTITSAITLSNLSHLYVSWELTGMVTFCFSSDGRYTIINVSHETGSFIMSSIDRRATEKQEDLTEEEEKERSERRNFYHIGALFDQAGKQTFTEDEMIDESEDIKIEIKKGNNLKKKSSKSSSSSKRRDRGRR